MANQYKTACVFGGTGFIGTQVVRELADKGYRIKVATRVPERAYDLRPCGDVGQVVPYACNYKNEDDIAAAVKGCDLVVNLIGILFEKRKNDFKHAHIDVPAMIAQACSDQNVPHFVHVSALGVDKNTSKYAKSKLAGEKAVQDAHEQAIILRPSVVFGAEDEFFNMFARLARLFPALPLVGGGKTKFQPVYVGDIADAVIAASKLNTGDVYQLGGPETVTFKQIYDRLFEYTGRTRTLISLPYGIAKIQGASFSVFSKIVGGVTGLTPKPLLTADQVESLKYDNIVSGGALGFADLGIDPTPMDAILPQYLNRFKPGGRFGAKKSA